MSVTSTGTPITGAVMNIGAGAGSNGRTGFKIGGVDNEAEEVAIEVKDENF